MSGLDRKAIPGNLLDRVEDLERRLDDLVGYAAMPTVDPEAGEGETTYVEIISEGDTRFVMLNGGNQALWIPNPADDATQDITGHFNLAGAAFQYKINGTHALSIPTANKVLVGPNAGQLAASMTSSTIVGSAIWGEGDYTYSVVIGNYIFANMTAAGNTWADVIIGNGIASVGDYDGSENVYIGYQVAQHATTTVGNTIGGYLAGTDLTTGDANTISGDEAAANLNSGSNNAVFGYHAAHTLTTTNGGAYFGNRAGYYETAANKLFIDNAQRASEADGRVKALVYGVFAAATANQYLTINGHLVALHDATATNFISNVAIGTQPYAATSITLNTNLNADLLDNEHGAYYLALANATGILASTLGGTGVNNAGTFTNATNSTITGGGTLALGGHVLTVPEPLIAAGRNVANTFTEVVRSSKGLATVQDVTNVDDPPTDAQLDGIFGTPATLGRGFIAMLDDNDDDTDVYVVWTSDASWFYTKGTKAL